jgi:hypothetical protein
VEFSSLGFAKKDAMVADRILSKPLILFSLLFSFCDGSCENKSGLRNANMTHSTNFLSPQMRHTEEFECHIEVFYWLDWLDCSW